MGKPRDTKVAILPSTTRKGTTLSTSAALDSPSVISQLVSPPQTSRVGISAESENSSNNFDDASTVLDNTGSLGPFLDATIARSRQIEITETPNENTVFNSPEIDDLDEDYVELDDDFIDKKRTPDEAEELLAKISKNHDDWSTPEPTPTPILKKRGMIELNDEDMREAKKSLMEKGIKSEDVKNLPPIEDLCKIIPPSSTIEYMKDIVSNKRKIPNEEISTMLANYSFNGKVPKKLGDPDKLIPTDISLQMADKSTAIPVGVCENVPVQVTQHCLILTDFVVLEMPEDDNMSIILGRPFLNTAGAVIDCNKGKVTFNVDDKEHTVYFPKRIDKDFEFHRSQTNPMVRYKIYNKTINLPFSDFCAAIRVPQWGSCEKVRGTPRELSNLYTMICHGRSFSDDGGKISSIQLPAIRYFAYFVTKKGWSITENELNAYIEREGHHARDGTEEAEEHLDSSSDAASSSYQHYGHVEPPRHSSAQGPYYHSIELEPEVDLMAIYEARAPEYWDARDWDFSVESEDDEPLTDGEEDLQFLADGELEATSDDDLFPWDGGFSSDEEEEEAEESEEEDSSSAGYPPAKRFRPGWMTMNDEEDEEAPRRLHQQR
ncbi:hypothetical protein QYE76_042928 [Lolium multiflorum]|uniref:Uncharacterized protein n=1 Tax=Lolium multiflorum TaxID=4521 RepID=A0AAD8WVE0_LOLMU|nr:hypothetical protein QYE76_042928 [Lolium multiflorum]